VGLASDEELLDRYPWGAIDHDNKEQWRGFLDHKLLVNRCVECGYWFDPPRPICPKCWSDHVDRHEVAGTGRIQWFTLLYQGLESATPDHPYPAVVIELDDQEGLRIDSTVVQCAPESISCDMPVELTWAGEERAPIPVFRPADPSLRTS
jgi:uncharacterized protein